MNLEYTEINIATKYFCALFNGTILTSMFKLEYIEIYEYS